MVENDNGINSKIIISDRLLTISFKLKNEDGTKILWNGLKNKDYSYSYICDENYILVYRIDDTADYPIHILAAYNVNNKCLEDITTFNKRQRLINMFFEKARIPLNVMLQMVAKEKIDICPDESYIYYKNYLCGEKDFSNEEIADYVINYYPFLAEYRKVDNSITYNDFIELSEVYGRFLPIKAISYNMSEEKQNVRSR